MNRRTPGVVSVLLAGLLAVSAARAGEKPAPKPTVVHDPAALDELMGKHLLALQWISWRRFGTAEVTEDGGVVHLTGRQENEKTGDRLQIEGLITEVGTRYFRFRGTITTRVSHINGGRPCRRRGKMTFRITGKRKYWRLQQMTNPCDGVTDYVDLFFQRPGQ